MSETHRQTGPGRAAPARSAWSDSVAIGLAVVTLLCYAPVLDAGFLNWDDPAYVTGNPNIRLLSWQTTRWAFTTFREGLWHPLTWLSLATDHALYGLDPRGFHLTNLMLHAGNTVLVFLTWERLTGALWRSAIVAALFGLHPMHVESVAWVTERKDVLSTLFWFLTIAAYARYARVETWTAYAIMAATFGLGLLAKPMLVTLPFVLLLLDYWPLRRLSRRAVLEKVPLVLAALAVAAVSVVAVADVSREAIPDPIPPWGRVVNALVSCVEYMRLTVWPLHLSPWYSHPWLEGPPLSPATIAAAVGTLAGITALVVAYADRAPYAVVGWLWYLVTLMPVLGLLYNGRQGMADRYAYIPHVGLFVAATWTVAELSLWRSRVARFAGAVVLAVVLMVLGVATSGQARIWHDDLTFWSYTARTNRYSFIAHQALGGLLSEAGRPRDALREFLLARRLRPDVASVHRNIGRLLMQQHRYAAAAAEYRKAVALRPAFADAHSDLGRALLAGGRVKAAVVEFRSALAISPGFAEARRGLDDALARRAAADAG